MSRTQWRWFGAGVVLVCALGVAPGVRADDAPAASAEDAKPPSAMKADLHGYYRVRGHLTTEGNADDKTRPGTVGLFEHRFLLRSRLGLTPNVSLGLEAFVFQNAPWGVEGGDVTTQSTEGRHLRRDTLDRLETDFGPRRGWGEVLFPNVGLLRVGRQPSDWGMGIVANDGDRRRNDFGDNYYGDTGDRIVFATKPLGADGPLVTAFGFGQVVEDDILSGADDVLEGLAAVMADYGTTKCGTYVVYRSHAKSDTDLYIVDLYGRGEKWGWFAESEAAFVMGQSRLFNSNDTLRRSVEQFGGAVNVGALEGSLRPALEVGLASGDGNLNADKRISNFRFNPDHNVGLILFEELLPRITEEILHEDIRKNVGLVPVAAQHFPTEGRVTNAVYLFPRVSYPVSSRVEARVGLVQAWALKDVVNPANLVTPATGGTNTGLRGADPSARNYGTELDAGVEYEFEEPFRLGAQGAVLFPGDVFDVGDDLGNKLRAPGTVAKGLLRFTWEF
ncbi:MAG: hypothetical protein HYY13_06965 [Nitrospirae bacterium]|nr:hypothetical protein [Nitrospirota bacterium]